MIPVAHIISVPETGLSDCRLPKDRAGTKISSSEINVICCTSSYFCNFHAYVELH